MDQLTDRFMYLLWKHRSYVAKAILTQSHRALVESVILYNCVTWARSSAVADRLDPPDRRKMLAEKVMGLHGNTSTYE
jgi:hypothetical protein